MFFKEFFFLRAFIVQLNKPHRSYHKIHKLEKIYCFGGKFEMSPKNSIRFLIKHKNYIVLSCDQISDLSCYWKMPHGSEKLCFEKNGI